MSQLIRSLLNNQVVIVLLFLTLTLVGNAPLWAQAPLTDAETEFTLGVEQFNARHYEQALAHFRASAQAGTDTAQLHYNLGVTYYKLERYREAETAFQRSLRHPQWAGLSYYNLALIAYKTQQPRQAQTYARAALKYSSDEKIHALSQEMLRRIDPQDKARGWHSTLAMAVGYDDNVLLNADASGSAISDEADSFVEFYWQSENRRMNRDSSNLSFGYGVYLLNYSDINDYDYADLSLTLKHATPLSQGQVEFGAAVSQSYLSGDSLQSVASGSLGYNGVSDGKITMGLRYRYDRYQMHDDDYAYLAGVRQQLSVLANWRLTDKRLTVSYRHEYNDRDDLILVNEFYSYSPIRDEIGIKTEWYRKSGWIWIPGLIYRQSLYQDPERRAGLQKRREDEEFEAKLELKRNIQLWWLGLSIRYNDNDSNFDEYDYDRSQLSLELMRQF